MKFFSSLTLYIFSFIAFVVLIIFNIKMWGLDRKQEKKISLLQKELIIQQNENERVQEINQKLTSKITGFKNNTNETIEEEARTNFGMVKEGETYYYIEKNDSNNSE